MKLFALLLCLLLLGGCVTKDGGSEVQAAGSSGRAQDEDGRGSRPPRQQCENTSIGGQPRSFCY